MDIFESFILGSIQGLTEFIPVSSSGHLYFLSYLLGIKTPPTAFILSVQIGTLFALLIYFRKKIQKYSTSLVKFIRKRKMKFVEKQDVNVVFNVIIATIPAILLGLVVNRPLETFYDTVVGDSHNIYLVTSIPMILVGIIFLLEKKIFKKNKLRIEEVTRKKALIIGISQTISFIRGISRSGITLITGQGVGLSRVAITEFTFLMSIPISILTSALGVLNIIRQTNQNLNVIIVVIGIISSFLTGYLAIDFLMKYVKKKDLSIFGWYRVIVGVILFVLFLSTAPN
ncbi:hypothetical protein D6810_00585 [Candidatus Dojkabacteria bacterium]|uniref:Undecaprenyl-diphosphatase n=1 Tax=Candidatus Dojkabacteria bacterium TaxID=2099670 RepID=A0A3M0Z1E0_9BACT|nr:MAG: hypothetical protein D6810_00585 [Candidatus Dojkabacteria bacterium]